MDSYAVNPEAPMSYLREFSEANMQYFPYASNHEVCT